MGAGVAASEPLRDHIEDRLGEFTELVATAISNTEARTQLAASRARIVAAADEERRRVVRDLHDGAQQRLVHTIITLKLAHRALQNEERGRSRAADRGARPRRAGDGRAARARARHPPSGPHPRRAARRSGRAGLADAGAGRQRRVRRPAPRRRRGDRLLRRRRGAHQRRQTRPRRTRRGRRRTSRTAPSASRCATTASEAPAPTAAVSSAWRTGSPSSTAGSGSRARRTAARSSPPTSRSPASSPITIAYRECSGFRLDIAPESGLIEGRDANEPEVTSSC